MVDVDELNLFVKKIIRYIVFKIKFSCMLFLRVLFIIYEYRKVESKE